MEIGGFYLPIGQKREYIDMILDVKYIHSRKYIYQKEKCIYVGSPNGMLHLLEREI